MQRRGELVQGKPRGSEREVRANILAHVALGGRVEGGKLHVAGVLGPHLIKHLLKGVESAVRRVHIVLVYLGERTGWGQSPTLPERPEPMQGGHRYSGPTCSQAVCCEAHSRNKADMPEGTF